MPSSNVDIKAYADALLSLAAAAGIMDSIERELAAAVELFDGNGALGSFVNHPRIRLEGRSRGLDELLDDEVPPALRHFFLILLEDGALQHLRRIADACYAELAERRRRASGELVTATELAPEHVAQIEAETGRILGKTVHLRVRVDPQLVGGLAVHVGDFIFDGSIENQLESIRRAMLTEPSAESEEDGKEAVGIHTHPTPVT